MAQVCADLALKSAKEGLSHEAFLYELARQECERRSQQRIERRLSQSGLPREKTFATFQLDRLPMPMRGQIERLRSGEFVKEATQEIARRLGVQTDPDDPDPTHELHNEI